MTYELVGRVDDSSAQSTLVVERHHMKMAKCFDKGISYRPVIIYIKPEINLKCLEGGGVLII